jgi:hypothetical protein
MKMPEYNKINGVKCVLRDDIWKIVQKRAYGEQIAKNEKLSNWPSELFDCKRKVYYSWLNAPRNGMPLEVVRIMDMGTLLHPYFGKLWSRAGFFSNEECHCSNKILNASFRPDFVGKIRNRAMAKLFNMRIGQLFVIDFKTISNRAYEFKDKTGQPGLPKLEDEGQLQFYMGEIRQFLGEDACPCGFLQYFSRDWARTFWNGRWKQPSQYLSDCAVFQIPASKKRYEECVGFFSEVEGFIKKGKVPAREGEEQGKYPCSGCDFSKHCWGK